MHSVIERINPADIIRDQFCPYRWDAAQRVSYAHVLFFLVCPTAFGVGLVLTLGPLSGSKIPHFLTVYSLLAAVLTALIAIIHSVVGTIEVKESYDFGAREVRRRLIVKLEVLRELYANISFNVLILVWSILPLVILLFAPAPIWSNLLSGAVYSVGAVVAIGFLHVLVGTYLILQDQAKDLEQRIKNVSGKSEQKK